MLETERLSLRPFIEQDTDAIFALRKDAEIMRFIRAPQKHRIDSVNWIKLVSSLWKTDKIGLCAVVEKQSNQLIGWCGLWRLQETGETEIGYAINKNFRRRGFALEAARACLNYGFNKLNLDKIVAVTRPENVASRGVMEKLGMKFDYIGRFYDRDLARYKISKDEFRRNHAE